MSENTSGLEPRGVAVLIQSYEPERKGALIELPDSVKGRMDMVDVRATVIAIGPHAWFDEGSPRAAVDEVRWHPCQGYCGRQDVSPGQ
jgi:hypothetical protein